MCSVLSILLVSLALLTVLPTSIWFCLYQEYGSLERVIAGISRHRVIAEDQMFKGFLTVCDENGNCGDLEVVPYWKYSDSSLKEYLISRYSNGSLIACYHYERKPTVYSFSPMAIYDLPMAIAVIFDIITFLFISMAIIIRCNESSKFD